MTTAEQTSTTASDLAVVVLSQLADRIRQRAQDGHAITVETVLDEILFLRFEIEHA